VKLRRRTIRAFDLTLVEYQGALWNEQLRQRDALRAEHAAST
jgi:hypothetical protein